MKDTHLKVKPWSVNIIVEVFLKLVVKSFPSLCYVQFDLDIVKLATQIGYCIWIPFFICNCLKGASITKVY